MQENGSRSENDMSKISSSHGGENDNDSNGGKNSGGSDKKGKFQ